MNNLDLTTSEKVDFRKSVEIGRAKLEKIRGKSVTQEEVLLAAQESELLDNVVSRKQTLEAAAALTRLRQAVTAGAKGKGLTKDFVENLQVLSSHAANAGRMLNAFKIKGEGIEASDPIHSIKEQIVEKLLDLGHNADKIIEAGKNVNWESPREVSKYYRTFVKPTFWELLKEFRYINMLSSPLTHIKNIFSNIINVAGIAPATRLVHGGVDMISSALTGRERKAYASQAPVYMKGSFNAIGDAYKNFADVMRQDKFVERPDVDFLPSAGEAASPWMKPLAKFNEKGSVILRGLEGMDAFFRTMAEAGEREAIANRLNKQGKEINMEAVNAEAKARAKRLVFREDLDASNKSGQGYLLSGIDYFTQKLMAARSDFSFENSKGERVNVSNPVGWVVPFVRTPTSILKQGIEYSPAGVLTMIGSKAKGEQLSKSLIGSAVFLGASYLAARGDTTWAAPTGKKDREEFYRSGKQAYSIKIGGKWYSFQQLGVLGFPVALAAAIRYHWLQDPKLNEREVSDKISRTLASQAKYFSDQSYVRGVGDLIAAAEGDESVFERLIQNQVTQVVPLSSFQAWVSRMVDPIYRNPDGIIESVKARTPFLSKEVKPYPNAERDMPWLNSFSPITVRTDKYGKPYK
jgi:hypothetical protein